MDYAKLDEFDFDAFNALDAEGKQKLRTKLSEGAEWFNGTGDPPIGLFASNAHPASAAWLNKSPTDILADVNAALAQFYTPGERGLQQTIEVYGAQNARLLQRHLRRTGPIPGSYWDFDRLVIPLYQWLPLKAALDRRQRKFLATWYRAKRRHARRRACARC